jgi:hypothetical protein
MPMKSYSRYLARKARGGNFETAVSAETGGTHGPSGVVAGRAMA